MCVHIVTGKKIKSAEIAETYCVIISLWADLSRLYVMAKYDCASADAVYKHVVQGSLQRGVKPCRLDQAEKSKCIAAHYEYRVV